MSQESPPDHKSILSEVATEFRVPYLKPLDVENLGLRRFSFILFYPILVIAWDSKEDAVSASRDTKPGII